MVIRKVARTLRHSVFTLLVETISQWGLSPLFKINKSDMEINFVGGGQIIFAGLDDVEKLKSIAGVTGMWIEEASEISQSDFQQLDLRLRGRTKHYKQIILSFNPISELHWLKSVFFDFKKPNAAVCHSTYLNNRFIDDEYKRVLEELKDQDLNYYKIYALGQWGSLGNLVYTNWTVDEAVPTDPASYPVVYFGMDFGFNDPSVCLAIGIKDQEVYVFDELHRTKLTNTEWIREVKDHGVPLNAYIFADSAEPDRIKEFRTAGFSRIQPAQKGKDSIKHGIDWLRGTKIYIHPRCTNTVKEIQTYSYKQDKDGNVLEDPVDFLNHCMDALRYGTEPARKMINKLSAVKRPF